MRAVNSHGPDSRFAAGWSRNYLLNLVPIAVALALIWPFGGGGHKVQMTNTQVAPAATGVIHVSKDSNGNTQLKLKVNYLAQPSSLTPPKAAYVVWIKPSGHPAKDQGVLKVGTDRSGKFETVTPYDQFVVFVTAENSPQPVEPNGEKVLTANVSG